MVLITSHGPRRLGDGHLLAVACVVAILFLVWAALQIPDWRHLTPRQQAVLQPLHAQWDQLSGRQRLRLIKSAARYSEMTPIEQRRFGQRLEYWASLSAEKRALARETYRAYKSVSADERVELRNAWILENYRDADSIP